MDAEAQERQRTYANWVSREIIAKSLRIHSKLGPGLLESVYHACLTHELEKSGLLVQAQLPLPVSYDSIRIDAGYRLDLLVADTVIVEVKAIAQILPIHVAQLLTYLRLSDKHLGLLINFNVPRLAQGVKRIVNRF
jgi:GxxExxY protein